MTRLVRILTVLGLLGGAFLYLQHAEPAWWAKLWYPLPGQYRPIVVGHARNYELEPELLAAVIYQESKFHPDAKSRSGAIGLMQLQPATAKGIALHTGGNRFVVRDLYDPEINVRYGAWYLHHLLQKYHDEKLALAAYNAGQRNVDEWRAADEGIGFPETRAYVKRVEHLKTIYRRAYFKS
jgi:soluble lytic murein transglycosylase